MPGPSLISSISARAGAPQVTLSPAKPPSGWPGDSLGGSWVLRGSGGAGGWDGAARMQTNSGSKVRPVPGPMAALIARVSPCHHHCPVTLTINRGALQGPWPLHPPAWHPWVLLRTSLRKDPIRRLEPPRDGHNGGPGHCHPLYGPPRDLRPLPAPFLSAPGWAQGPAGPLGSRLQHPQAGIRTLPAPALGVPVKLSSARHPRVGPQLGFTLLLRHKPIIKPLARGQSGNTPWRCSAGRKGLQEPPFPSGASQHLAPIMGACRAGSVSPRHHPRHRPWRHPRCRRGCRRCCGLLAQHIRLSPPREQVVLPAAGQIRCISPTPTGQEKTAIKIRFKNKSARGHGLTVPQPAPCLPPPLGHDYLRCSRSSRQEKLPVQTRSSLSPPEPQNTGKHPKNPRETGLPACFGQAWQEGSKHGHALPEPGTVCFALEERGGRRVCFGSFNLFTHTQKNKKTTKKPQHPSWEAGGRPGARRARMLWCYLRSLALLGFPAAVLRHGQERREGQLNPVGL